MLYDGHVLYTNLEKVDVDKTSHKFMVHNTSGTAAISVDFLVNVMLIVLCCRI